MGVMGYVPPHPPTHARTAKPFKAQVFWGGERKKRGKKFTPKEKALFITCTISWEKHPPIGGGCACGNRSSFLKKEQEGHIYLSCHHFREVPPLLAISVLAVKEVIFLSQTKPIYCTT